MNEQVLEIIRILVSISIPLVILVLGILINKTLEKIRQVQFEFNEFVRFAHAEILEISPYKASQP